MPEKQVVQWQLADIIALVGLILLILLFVAPALSPDKVLAPLDIVSESWPPWQQPNQTVTVHNFMLTDVVNYIIPVKQFMVNALREGEHPLWNPYVFTGYPFTYNTQAGVWYPLSLLYYLLPFATAVDATVILQMILGALFMYAYLRQIGTSRLAAIVGTVIFTFNGFMVVWLEWQVVQAAVLWLPLQLWLVERIAYHLQHTGRGNNATALSIISGLVFAVPWLGGHWNWTLFTSMTVIVYLLWRLVPLFKNVPDRVQRRHVLLPLLLTLSIGPAVALIQVLPAFVYLSQTHRQPMTFAQSLDHGLLNRLVVMIVPNFFGNPIHNNWWGPQNFNETTFYLGLMPLLLAGMALLLRRDRWTIFFSVWGTLGLLWALRSPVYYLLHVLPVFNGLFPSRAIFLTVISVAVLAALSVDRLQQPGVLPHKRPLLLFTSLLTFTLIGLAGVYFWRYQADVSRTWAYLRPQTITAAIFLATAAGLIIARLSSYLSARLFTGLALICLVSDLFVFGHNYNTVASLGDWFGETAIADFLHAEPTPYRIITPAESIVYSPNTALIDAIPNISGYEPGIWQRITNYLRMAEGESSIRFGRVLMPLHGISSPLIDAINGRYIVTTKNEWGSEPTAGPAQKAVTRWQPLPPGETARLRFLMPDAGLYRLDLHLRADGELDGAVTVRIFTADGVLQLAHSSLESASISSNAENAFYFEAMPSEWGRDFLAEIQVEGADILLGIDDSGSPAFAAYYLPRPNLAFEDGKSQIYRNPGAFERAYFVPQAIVANNKEEAQTVVLEHADELDRVVILEVERQPLPPDLGSAGIASAEIDITHYSLNRVELTAVTDISGFLVLSDTYYPGWQATSNGQSTPIYQANSLVRAIYLPEGEHSIVFSFRPPDFIFGAAVSGLTLLGCLIALANIWYRRQ